MGKKSKAWDNAYNYLKGLDPGSSINYSKLDKKLQSKIKKILGSRKRGSNSGENSGSNRRNFTLAGISKLKNKLNSGSSGHSKEYEKAKKIAEDEAKRITEELEKQFVAKISQKSKNEKISERQRRNRNRERIELKKMNNKNQESASTFIQAVQSNEYSKEELMKNFCKINNERIQDNIVVNLFIPKFNANIEEIRESLEFENKLEVLSKNFYELEVHYNQIFIRFHELQSKFLRDPSFQINLEELLKNIKLQKNTLEEKIDEINKNGFNLELVNSLQDWIEQFKKKGFEKYNLVIKSLQENFVLKEQKSEIEPILEQILLRKQLLKIKEELTKDNFESIMRQILLNTHGDKIILNIKQLKNILEGSGSPNNFFEKYEIGYFTAKEYEMVRTLVDELMKNIESLKQKYDDDLKKLDSEKEEEKSLLDEEFYKFKNPISDLNKNKDKIQNKQKEINDKKKEVENKFKQLINNLNKNFAKAQEQLFNKLQGLLSGIHNTATQRFNEDKKILERYFDLQKKMEQEGGVGKNELPLVIKSKDYTSIFENSYINFFYPIEFLLTEYKKIITNYNELFTEVLNIKDKLYFYIKIYNRLKSKDIATYSCTFAYIAFQILNFESNTVNENDFIEAFRDYCKNPSFSDDISANAPLNFLKQLIPSLTGSQEELKLLLPGTSSNIARTSNTNTQSLVEYSKEAAEKRQANKNRLNAKQKEREENEKRRRMEKISNLFGRIKNRTSNNRELTLQELKTIKDMKKGLNKELEGLNSQQELEGLNSQQKIQNYLTQLNINKRISKEERRLRELEIVEILKAANNLSNDKPITDIKKTLDKLIKIKENNKNILTESNNQIIDELIKRLKSIYNKSNNSSTFESKLQKFETNKEKYKNSKDVNELNELLEKVILLLNIKGINKKKIDDLKLDKDSIKKRIKDLEIPNLTKFISLKEEGKVKNLKTKVSKQRGEEKEWYSKIDNILFISKENTNKIRKEKKIQNRKNKEKIEKYKSKFLKLVIDFSNEDGNVDEVYINDTVKDFIDKIALPLWYKLNVNKKLNKKLNFMKNKFSTNKTPPQEEIDRLKIKLQNIFMDRFHYDKEKITISNLFYRFFINFDIMYNKFLKIIFNKKSNKTDDQNLDFVISLVQ